MTLTKTDIKLRIPQLRVLQALLPFDLTLDQTEWPIYTKIVLAVKSGYSPISGSITRALLGIKERSSSGNHHKGLIPLGLIEEVKLDIDGREEINYRLTKEGAIVILQFIFKGGKLPSNRNPESHTNNRYKDN